LIILDKREAWKEECKKIFGRDHFFPRTDKEKLEAMMECCSRIMGKKKTKITEEQIKQYYNVYVYQVLPYPPNSKNSKLPTFFKVLLNGGVLKKGW
jgi:hypothetical protein